MTIRRSVASVAVAVALFVFAACGSDDPAGPSTTVPTAATADGGADVEAAVADFNDADVEFAQGMIAHHEQAIEMAEIALDPNVGARPEVVDLATRVKAAQDPEITMMAEWLTSWDMPMDMDMSDGHDMSSMDGMMSADEMDALGGLTGADFDVAWLQMMIEHHQGAISEAETARGEGSNPGLLALADQIISAQQAEIDEMNGLLTS